MGISFTPVRWANNSGGDDVYDLYDNLRAYSMKDPNGTYAIMAYVDQIGLQIGTAISRDAAYKFILNYFTMKG